MEVEVNAPKDKGSLIPGCSTTMENAHALHYALPDMSGTVVDSTVALRRPSYGNQRRKKAEHDGGGPEFAERVKNLGVIRHVGCWEDSSETCLWQMVKA